MGKDDIRHLVLKAERYYWQPSATVKALGFTAESLGPDYGIAKERALKLNGLADDTRRAGKSGANGPMPGTVSCLFKEYQESDEFLELKPRTRADYEYYMGKIELDFGLVMVRALTTKIIKTYYRRVRKSVSLTWGYHILATFRTVLKWAKSEDWIGSNPADGIANKAPKKRTVIWTPEQAALYIAKAGEMGWPSIVAMAHVFDSIGQSPVDVRTLPRKAYDGRCVDVTRAKTGRTDAPIPLFPEAVKALDEYLREGVGRLPDAPLFTNDRIGGEWNESTLQKTHRKIRVAAGLPSNLQLQDFRTTAMTEGGAAKGTSDELRGLARHATRDAGEHYVHPDTRYVESIQKKRLALRKKAKGKAAN